MFKEKLKEMFINFEVVDKERFNLYYKKLKESGLDEDKISNSINNLIYTWRPEYGRKLPSIAEIIGIDVNTKETADLEQAWEIFTKTYCNNHRFEPMPDFVYTIKKAIGEDEVENSTPETLKWIKKEFIRIYPAVKIGMMALKQEPCKYEIIGGSTIRIDDKSAKLIEENKMYQISEINGDMNKQYLEGKG
jgi:hypothetical protein